MEDLENRLSDVQKYSHLSNQKTQYPIKNKIIDEDTERILVSIVSAAIVAAPLVLLASKLLPDIPIYNIYRYLPF